MKKHNEQISYSGHAWMNFMETHHKSRVRQMRQAGTYETKVLPIIARCWNGNMRSRIRCPRILMRCVHGILHVIKVFDAGVPCYL